MPVAFDFSHQGHALVMLYVQIFMLRLVKIILADPGADSGGKRKSKREGKYGTKKSKERREGSLLFFVPYFPARLDFLLPPLPAPGSPRVGQNLIGEFMRKIYAAS